MDDSTPGSESSRGTVAEAVAASVLGSNAVLTSAA